MLSELRIRNLGVIADALVGFAPGLTALTGETGAGKTMIVAGLGQLLGARGDAGVVRHGTDRAIVEGRWTLDDAALASASELGAEADGDELLTVRHVNANGRSRALVGGAQTPVGVMADLVGEWATIHGQSEQVRLGSAERQREVLDDYAVPADLPGYRRAYAEYRTTSSELATLVDLGQARAREVDVLRYGLDEIAAVDPQPGEDRELALEANRLQATDDLRLLAMQVQAALSGGDDYDDPGAVGLVGQARKAAAQLADLDETAATIASRVADLSFQLNDVAADLAGYTDDLPSDPLRLEAVTERRAALSALVRKYGDDIDGVLAWAEASAARLTELEGSDERIAALRARLGELDEQLTAAAAGITAARADAASRLADEVRGELAALAMPHARLEFAVTRLAERGPHGADRVELMFAANPGASLAPLAKVASGGELSRLRLALEVVLARGARGHTFVFDEVDAGVGGAVGLEIGRRLKRLGETSQVIVVTHLAQVAAFADAHLVVTKSSDGEVTSSDVVAVCGEDRASELARMMAGLGESSAAIEHAADLLKEAGAVG